MNTGSCRKKLIRSTLILGFGMMLFTGQFSVRADETAWEEESGVGDGLSVEDETEEAVEPETEKGTETEDTLEIDEEDVKGKKQPYKTRLTLGMRMYKGDSTYVGIRYNRQYGYSVSSSDSAVVSVTKKGKLKAVKCGKVNISVTVNNGKKVKKLVLHVQVIASSYAKTASHGERAMDVGNQGTGITVYRELEEGATLQLKTRTSEESSLIYTSSNPDVAEVSDTGKITAKKTGNCTVRVEMDGKEKSNIYYIVLYVVKPQELTVTNAEQDQFFTNSAMAGNSLGVGLRMYCEKQYDGFLGNAVHLSEVSYSLRNDAAEITTRSLHPKYQGKKYRVKDALKVMGARKVFLSFGMNDLDIFGVKGFADAYQEFIQEIQKENPNIEVYVVSMTPVIGKKGRLENGNIQKLNEYMCKYADATDDVYFIDLYSDLADDNGSLKQNYCSDGFCHLKSGGYQIWTSRLKEFARQQIMKQTLAQDAVITAEESRGKKDYAKAVKLVEQLDKGCLRNDLQTRLDKIKGKLND